MSEERAGFELEAFELVPATAGLSLLRVAGTWRRDAGTPGRAGSRRG